VPCPWYRNGMCTSPRLRQPSRSVVSPQRCLGSETEYKSCRFYVEPPQQGGGGRRGGHGLVETMKPALAQQLRPYQPIHLLARRPSSRCPFFKVYSYGGGYLAYCKVLNRLLTRSEVELCEKYWQTCPFYRLASRREDEEVTA